VSPLAKLAGFAAAAALALAGAAFEIFAMAIGENCDTRADDFRSLGGVRRNACAPAGSATAETAQ